MPPPRVVLRRRGRATNFRLDDGANPPSTPHPPNILSFNTGARNRGQALVSQPAFSPLGQYCCPMTVRRRDRVAFALLVPSLAVPIAAMALAAWRMGHLDDGQIPTQFGIGLYYFAAMVTLSATIFSMTINAVLALRNHASIDERAIPFGRLSPHFAVALVAAAWAIEFGFEQMGMESLAFGAALVTGSVISFALVTHGRVAQRRIEVTDLDLWAERGLIVYSFLVAAAGALGIYCLVTQSELLIIAVALLGFLGLPWTGVSVLFWLPAGAITFVGGAQGTALPLIFLLLAGGPAVANAVLAIVFVRSGTRRTDFVNDFLEARSPAEPSGNTLAP